jgi:hypothetical protein
MSEAEHFLKDARKSFRLASDASLADDIERHAGKGREYLRLAHLAAKVSERLAVSPTWRGSQ